MIIKFGPYIHYDINITLRCKYTGWFKLKDTRLESSRKDDYGRINDMKSYWVKKTMYVLFT